VPGLTKKERVSLLIPIIDTLGDARFPDAITTYVEALGMQDESVSLAVVRAAGKLGGREATALLVTVALLDGSEAARQEASATLAKGEDAAEAIVLLTLQLKDGKKKTRKAAAEALSIMGSTQS